MSRTAAARPQWVVVRRWAVLLAVLAPWGLLACSGDDTAAPPTTGGTSAATAPDVATTTATTTPNSAVPVSTLEPPSEECQAAGRVIADDVALGGVTGADSDTATRHTASLADALELLADSDTAMARPAAALVASGEPPARMATIARDTVDELNATMVVECGLRLTGIGAMRPDRTPGDALDGLGIAELAADDTCATADVLRWADARWRLSTDGGTQDRFAVIVREALAQLRRGDGGDLPSELREGLDLPADIDRANLAGFQLSGDHKIAIIRLDADMRRACGAGLLFGGLLMEGSFAPADSLVDAIPTPAWGQPATVDADTAHSRWCAIGDAIYANDVAARVSELDGTGDRDAIAARLRLMIGSLRIASRVGGSIATLADVRDTIVATKALERADLSTAGGLTADERRAAGELDRLLAANCGVGLSSDTGIIGPYVLRSTSSDPDADPNATTTVPETTTTSTSLPTVLPTTAVAVVGDSLTASAQDEIIRTLSTLGLGVVTVDGQVSRRMTSSTDTIRSGEDVVTEIATIASPKVWVIALGTNDVASGSPPETIRSSVQRVLDAIPTDSLVVWVDTYIRDEPEAVAAGNLIIRDVVSGRPGAMVVDFFSYGDDPGVVVGDGVHLTDMGQQLFANVIANGIAQVLGRNPTFDVTVDTTVPFFTLPVTTLPVITLPTTTLPAALTTTTTTMPATTTTTTTVPRTTTTTTTTP